MVEKEEKKQNKKSNLIQTFKNFCLNRQFRLSALPHCHCLWNYIIAKDSIALVLKLKHANYNMLCKLHSCITLTSICFMQSFQNHFIRENLLCFLEISYSARNLFYFFIIIR